MHGIFLEHIFSYSRHGAHHLDHGNHDVQQVAVAPLRCGFHYPESNGTWNEGAEQVVAIQVDAVPGFGRQTQLLQWRIRGGADNFLFDATL